MQVLYTFISISVILVVYVNILLKNKTNQTNKKATTPPKKNQKNKTQQQKTTQNKTGIGNESFECSQKPKGAMCFDCYVPPYFHVLLYAPDVARYGRALGGPFHLSHWSVHEQHLR